MTPINFHQSSQALSPWCILTSEINTFCTRLTVIKAATSKATNGFVGAIKGRVEAGVDTVGMWTKRIIIENVLFLMAFLRLPARVRKSLASAWFTQRKLIKISPSRVSDETMERKKKHRKNAAFNLIICINRGMKLLMKLKKFFCFCFHALAPATTRACQEINFIKINFLHSFTARAQSFEKKSRGSKMLDRFENAFARRRSIILSLLLFLGTETFNGKL